MRTCLIISGGLALDPYYSARDDSNHGACHASFCAIPVQGAFTHVAMHAYMYSLVYLRARAITNLIHGCLHDDDDDDDDDIYIYIYMLYGIHICILYNAYIYIYIYMHTPQ